MAFAQNDKTKRFVRQVKQLEESGAVRSFKEIAEEIEYNHTALSQVLSGNRNVPNDVYARFTEVYNPVDIENPQQLNMELLLKIEAMNNVILGAMAEVLAHQRGQTVTKVANDLVSTVNSQLKVALGKLQ